MPPPSSPKRQGVFKTLFLVAAPAQITCCIQHSTPSLIILSPPFLCARAPSSSHACAVASAATAQFFFCTCTSKCTCTAYCRECRNCLRETQSWTGPPQDLCAGRKATQVVSSNYIEWHCLLTHMIAYVSSTSNVLLPAESHRLEYGPKSAQCKQVCSLQQSLLACV